MGKNIFIMAGEASGDLHGAMLVNELKNLDGNLRFFGVGGRKLKDEGAHLLYDYSRFSSMGMVEPLFKLRFYKNALKNICSHVRENDIDTLILIDFPGFNLLLAQRLKKRTGVRIIYYISPQIWAWHYSRIKKIKKYVDAIIVLYPFEEEIYRKEGVRSYFRGNPLVDNVVKSLKEADDIEVDISSPCIALMPGSRISEIRRLLPPMLEAAKMLAEKYGSTFLLPVLRGDAGSMVEEELKRSSLDGLDIHLVFDNTYKAIEKADIVILSSGTATLETAILEKPMVVLYQVGFISEIAARVLVRIESISLANIVAEKKMCTELLQSDVNPERIYEEVCRLLDDKKLYNNMIKEVKAVKEKLGEPGAIKRIAKEVLSLIHE